MDSTWSQLLVGLLTVAGFFLTVAAGLAVLIWLPVRVAAPATPRRTTSRTGRYQVAWRRLSRDGFRRWQRLPGRAAVRWAMLLRRPARLVVLGFALAVLVGTVLLSLPVATESGHGAGLLTAVFTATSAVCVTGLVVVDTGSYWSGFGEAVILGLIQIGGFGIMTLASLLGLLVARRLGVRLQLSTQTETKSLGLGDVRRVVFGVLWISVFFEVTLAAVLTWRFSAGYGQPLGTAAYHGVFHAVSAFNNAGFGLYPDSLVRFVDDPFICLPISVAVIAGGLGFPVLFELRRHVRTPRRWSLHTKITVGTTVVLLVVGSVLVTAAEWTNPATLGRLDVGGKLLAGFFHAVMPRTAGFNSLDMAAMREDTLLVNDFLMFIGGGQRRHRGRHQGHDVRAARLRDSRRDPRRAQRARTRAAPPGRDPAPGAHRRAAQRRRRRRVHASAAGVDTVQPGPGAVRGGLRVRHRRTVDRYHRRRRRGRSCHPYRVDVRRPAGPGHPRLGPGAA